MASTCPAAPARRAKAKRRAIIPDPRNDENLAVAQTHLAIIRFHNRVVDTLPASVPAAQRFEQAREKVTKHYQWMLRTDYLPRICARTGRQRVRQRPQGVRGRRDADRRPDDADRVLGGAFRLGHSMVRAGLQLEPDLRRRRRHAGPPVRVHGAQRDLGGKPRLPSTWIADFRRLYDFGEAGGAI